MLLDDGLTFTASNEATGIGGGWSGGEDKFRLLSHLVDPIGGTDSSFLFGGSNTWASLAKDQKIGPDMAGNQFLPSLGARGKGIAFISQNRGWTRFVWSFTPWSQEVLIVMA